MSTEFARTHQGQTLPSYIKAGDTRGAENITSRDVRFPALKLAQGTSPQVKRANPKFIPDLREGDFFNTATKEIYGEGPIKVLFVTYVGHRHNLYDPKDRNVVLESNLLDTDKRTEWTTDANGKRVKPEARKFEDFLVVVYQEDANGKVTHEPEVATLTLSGTQLKKATDINTDLKYAKLPTFAVRFNVTPIPESGNGNSWYGYQFIRDGFPPEAVYLFAEQAYNSIQGKRVVAEDDEPTGETVDHDSIPF